MADHAGFSQVGARVCLLALALAWASAATAAQPAPSRSDERVWHWFVDCPMPVLMKFEVLHRGDLVYASPFPMCWMPRDRVVAEIPPRALDFALSDERLRLFGQPPKTSFEVRARESSMEKDGIVLELTFAAHDKIAGSVLVALDAGKTTEQSVAPGVVIRISPMGRPDDTR